MLEELSPREEDRKNNRYIDLYISHLKNSNRNVDLIFKSSLIELFKMDYKEFAYTCGKEGSKEGVLVGYSSFEIDLLRMMNHYGLENFRAQVRRFVEFNRLNLFIILSTYCYYGSSRNAQDEEEKVSKQLLVSSCASHCQSQANRDLYNLVLEFVESAIPATKIKDEHLGGDDSYSSRLDSEFEPATLELDLELFNIHDLFFSRKKLEPMIKDLISNMH